LTRPVLDKAPDEGALRKAISEGLQPEMPAAWQLSPREVADVAAYVRSLGTVKPESLPGDVGRGAAVYQAKGCAGCHILGGRGSGVGPELTGIGAKRNAAYLRESVRRPAASLPEDYLLVEAVFADGKVIRGMRANEDPFTLQLRDLKSGEYRSYRKRDLKDVRRLSKESSMPAYPVGSISDSELEDLVAYLASQRGSR
jgi:putative heme-binding domain-containing protein